MTTLLGTRTLFAAPLLVALAAWALPATPIEAASLAGPETTALVAAEVTPDALATLASNCTYYNNANHSQIVGQFGYDCCNNRVAWGRKTQYAACGGCFPCVPPPQ